MYRYIYMYVYIYIHIYIYPFIDGIHRAVDVSISLVLICEIHDESIETSTAMVQYLPILGRTPIYRRGVLGFDSSPCRNVYKVVAHS